MVSMRSSQPVLAFPFLCKVCERHTRWLFCPCFLCSHSTFAFWLTPLLIIYWHDSELFFSGELETREMLSIFFAVCRRLLHCRKLKKEG
jgi:hypothetical protein